MRKVRMTGVEPAIPKAANFKFAVYFQFHHTRVKLEPTVGIEPTNTRLQGEAITTLVT